MTPGNQLYVGAASQTHLGGWAPGNIGGGYYCSRRQPDQRDFLVSHAGAGTDIHDDLDRWTEKDDWLPVTDSLQPGDVYIHETVPEIAVDLAPAGFNRRLQVYLAEGYNIRPELLTWHLRGGR